MATNYRENNMLINDPVPRNISKFPIHQTYLTSDSERTGTGGYKFKAPEVWSSARSGKKSIAIRSIEHIKKRHFVSFKIYYKVHGQSNISGLEYSVYTDLNDTTVDVISNFVSTFNSSINDVRLNAYYLNDELRFSIAPASGSSTYDLKIVDSTSSSSSNTYYPPTSFNIFFNQPLDYLQDFSSVLIFKNVWDRTNEINFHASFIPFDNYQYLGKLGDKWNNPIIYQDPNTSPLFNVWITTDLKTPLPILHEEFVIRITFIISSDSQYHT